MRPMWTSTLGCRRRRFCCRATSSCWTSLSCSRPRNSTSIVRGSISSKRRWTTQPRPRSIVGSSGSIKHRRSDSALEGRMSSSCKIAIVGGGLAGLAAAHALKTFGIEAEVFETAPALGEIGAAVNVSPQAVKALKAIGVGDKIAAVGNTSPGIYTRNMQTGELLELNDRHKAAARYGAPYYTFHRAAAL